MIKPAPIQEVAHRLLATTCVVFLLALTASAQSASDACAGASAILPNQNFLGSTTVGATPDGASSCDPAGSGPDRWYAFTPTVSGRARIYVTYASGHDMHVSVHSGCPGTLANEVACNDDSTLTTLGRPRVTASLDAGVTYYLRFADLAATPGAFQLALEFPIDVWPRNDDPSNPVLIGPGVHEFEGTGADTYDPIACIGGGAVWFRYLPKASGPAHVDLCTYSSLPTALADTTLDIFEGNTQVVGCSDDSCMYQAAGNWTAVAGREYWIRVADFWGVGGSFVLTMTGPPSRADGCATPPELVLGEQLVSVTGANVDGVSTCDLGVEPDSVFVFVAPTDGVLAVTTNGTHDDQGLNSGPDTLLSIHSVCPGSAADVIACADDSPGACPDDASQIADAYVEAPLAMGAVCYVRVARKVSVPSLAPIRLTATFRPGLPTCAGDGSASLCPCSNFGNAGHGCGNSANVAGTRLSADGDPSVSRDSLTLRATSLLPATTTLFLQGSAQPGGGAGVAFGDGLRCVSGVVVRLGFRTASGGSASFGAEDAVGASIAALGSVPVAGGLRHYQVWYRDAATYCTSAAFNLSNALSIAWGM